ncbi:glycosyltransferase family 2 protein, partial [Xanthobacter sp. DSM 24535]|uniref:glycosyltransferase family 2 protein n=1 Tax=Roseixanthobacter psychrophilus TaxID=3119917 RepID=UPI003727C8DD
MKVAVITMVYNEKINLPIWMSYYGNMFGSENLYIIDHGSNDGSVDNIGEASRIKLPRGVYENESRAQMISRFHSSLLSYYDVVIYTDCDEMIVADPEYFKDLKEYLENEEFKHLTLVGLNIIHNSVTEEDIDWTAPIL